MYLWSVHDSNRWAAKGCKHLKKTCKAPNNKFDSIQPQLPIFGSCLVAFCCCACCCRLCCAALFCATHDPTQISIFNNCSCMPVGFKICSLCSREVGSIYVSFLICFISSIAFSADIPTFCSLRIRSRSL